MEIISYLSDAKGLGLGKDAILIVLLIYVALKLSKFFNSHEKVVERVGAIDHPETGRLVHIEETHKEHARFDDERHGHHYEAAKDLAVDVAKIKGKLNINGSY